MLLVIMAVVVALVMSVASRSLSDTVLSRQERESSAAFSVAETGVENALNLLRQGSVPTGLVDLSDSGGLVSGQFGVTPLSTYSLYLREGEIASLDLSGFGGGNLAITWTKKGDSSEDITTCVEGSGGMPAAIEISALQLGSNMVERDYYNPANCAISGNGFAGSADGGSEYRSSIAYPVPQGSTSLRLRSIYSGATISVAGGLSDTQLYLIQASASGGDAQKEIEVKRGLDAPSSVFDFALFSGQTIVK